MPIPTREINIYLARAIDSPPLKIIAHSQTQAREIYRRLRNPILSSYIQLHLITLPYGRTH